MERCIEVKKDMCPRKYMAMTREEYDDERQYQCISKYDKIVNKFDELINMVDKVTNAPKRGRGSSSVIWYQWGTSNLGNNEATPSGSFFMNIDNNGEFASNTPISEKIDKIERQIGEGKLRLLDNDGNPLVPTGIVESDSEVEVVFDETANLRIPTSDKDRSDKGYGTNSLLEQ
ncbi:hypothetical protein Tco_1047505 [Tanacetum coccineum]